MPNGSRAIQAPIAPSRGPCALEATTTTNECSMRVADPRDSRKTCTDRLRSRRGKRPRGGYEGRSHRPRPRRGFEARVDDSDSRYCWGTPLVCFSIAHSASMDLVRRVCSSEHAALFQKKNLAAARTEPARRALAIASARVIPDGLGDCRWPLLCHCAAE